MSMQNPQRKNMQRHWDGSELAIACQSAEEQKPLLCEAWLGNWKRLAWALSSKSLKKWLQSCPLGVWIPLLWDAGQFIPKMNIKKKKPVLKAYSLRACCFLLNLTLMLQNLSHTCTNLVTKDVTMFLWYILYAEQQSAERYTNGMVWKKGIL